MNCMINKFIRNLSVYLLFIFLTSTQFLLSQQNNALELINANFLEHGDFVSAGSPDYGFTNKVTVAVWFIWTADPQSVLLTTHESEGRYANLVTIDRHNQLNSGQFWLQHSRDNSKYEFDVRTTSGKKNVQTSEISNSADSGKWNFLVGVYDDNASSSLKIYLNGKTADTDNELSGNINSHNSNDRLNFGRVPSGYRFFTGQIDEVRIWKGALTQDEIRQQMFSKQTVRSTDLGSYWNLDETTGITVDDSGPQNADGTFYSSLVDIHSFTTDPSYKVWDNDKNWPTDRWAGLPLFTIAGAGEGETNTVSSNTSITLTLENPWITEPVLDVYPDPLLPDMTWYGITDASETSQWVQSGAPVSENSAFVNTTTPVSVGPAGAQITVTITSSPSSTNNLGVYQAGSLNNPAVTNETFPSGVDRRMDLVWGVNEWGSVTANLQFLYSNVPGVSDPSQLVLIRRQRDTDNWFLVSATNDTENKIFSVNGITSFYEYSIGSNSSNPLPVELSSFTGKYLNEKKCIQLNWTTQTEVNNFGFEIERLLDNKYWQKSGFVNGNGNSNSPKEYSFTDQIIFGGKIFYRLKQIDNDGLFSYSNVIEINIPAVTDYELEQNYPNPFNPGTVIKFSVPKNEFVSLKVYNVLGVEISTLINQELPQGNHEVHFDATGLASGVYIYTLSSASFNKSYKMILTK